MEQAALDVDHPPARQAGQLGAVTLRILAKLHVEFIDVTRPRDMPGAA